MDTKKNHNNAKLYQFLCKYKTLKTGAFTHTSLGDPLGSYYIPMEQEDIFYKLYGSSVKNGESLYLTEKHRNLSPILLDFDFRYHTNGELKRIYTITHLNEIVQIYVKILNEYFDTENIKIYLFEKGNPTIYKDDIAKDGIHIIIPEIVTKPAIQYILRERFIKEANNLFTKIGFSNSIEDIVDKCIIEKNNWLMYGSTKPNSEIYKVTRTYEIKNKDVELISNSKISTNEKVKLFSIRNKFNENKIKIEKKNEINNYENILNKEQKKTIILQQATYKYPNKMNKNYYDNIELVKKFVGILNPKRAIEYDSWIRLGWCLKTIDERLLETWIEFSKNSKKYEDGECDKLWDKMKEIGLGIGTLRMWAKQDNPKQYEDVTRSDWKQYLLKAITKTDYDLAKVVYHMFKYDYICSSIKDNRWYQFRNHRWEEIDSAYTLRHHLSTDVVNEFMKLMNDFTNQAIQETDPEEKQRFQDKAAKFMKVIIELKNTAKKNNIIKECAVLFYYEKFEDILDSNVNLVGFKNGVYDLELLEFRDGRPDDFISFSTHINYIEFDENNPLTDSVIDFINKIMPRAHLADYILKCLASFLCGKNKEEKFHIWTGNGCHSIDTPIRMFDGTLKMIQDIEVGEQLMGDDSTARNVLRLWRGTDKMYKITPVKGTSYTFNGNHKLALKVSHQGNPSVFKTSDAFVINWRINGSRKSKQYNNEDDAIKFIEENLSTIKNNLYKRSGKYNLTWHEIINESEDDGMIVKNNKKAFETEEELENYKESLIKNQKVLKYGDTVIISINNFLKYKLAHEKFSLYRTDIDYQNKDVEIDPYMLGYWLGDGHSTDSAITTMDEKVVEYYDENSKYYNCELVKNKNPKNIGDNKSENKASTYRLVSLTKSTNSDIRGKSNTNLFIENLKNYNLWDNKHIPEIYKINDKNIRLELLAGIIDSDGHLSQNSSGSNNFEITFQNEKLLDDVVELANSLGFTAYKSKITKTCTNNGKKGTYYRTQIHGFGIENIPTKLDRKQASVYNNSNSDPSNVSFKIEELDEDNYYGVEVDNNHLYVIGTDYLVSSNSNGKSKISELFQKAFGDYCGNFNVSMLTQKRGASTGTNSELVKAKGKRFMLLQEPGENDRINVGLMKELTGGDKVQARGLYREPIEFKPQFKLVLACNDLPAAPPNDGGTWRRVRVLPFMSRFTENPDPRQKYEFKLDNELSEKLELWKETFMSILVKYYKEYLETGIIEPSEVMESTEKYRRENDCYSEFISNRIEYVPNSYVDVGDLYEEFKNYFASNMPSGKIPSMPDYRKTLERIFGPVKGNKWKGIKLIPNEVKFINVNENDDNDTEVDEI
jgi:P4 family phage/plasmid primase-like protien